jgi:hypothetical protein
MVRFFFFLIGFGLTIIGSIYIIIYLNLTTIGYNFLEYVKFIIRRVECLNFIFGIIIMFLSLNKEDKNELYIRHFTKF